MSSPSSFTTRPKPHHHLPPPPTPRILHFPLRRRRLSSTRGDNTNLNFKLNSNKLETLFHHQQQNACDNHHSERRRERVERSSSCDGLALEEEKWKFQAEMLRAECNLLRMEKEIALKKLDTTRSMTHKTLTSALHTLLSGRMKICEGMDIGMVLDQEIHELTEKLEKFQRRLGNKDSEGTRKCRNFDKQVSVLQRRLEKIGGSSEEIYLKEFQEMENISFSIKRTSTLNHNVVASGKLNVDILRRKMEVLSKGILLQRMEEEYNSLLSSSNSSLSSSASTSKRIESQDSSSIRVPRQQEKVPYEGNKCSGHCKTIVQRIVEQVRAETEQWSQMQEMLGQVREEMEELQASRDFWEDQAVHSEFQIQSLHNAVQEWRERAVLSESKTNELEAKLSMLSGELESMRKEKNAVQGSRCSPIPLDTQNELEKRIVVCCSNENIKITQNSKSNEVQRNSARRRAHAARSGGFVAPKRSPFQDIGNSSLSMRQNGKAVYPLYCYLSSDAGKTH